MTSSDAGAEVEALLEDDFEAKQTRVKGAPFMVCNAAQTDGSPKGLSRIPEDHLACYQISDAQGEPQFAGDVENVTDQFNPTGGRGPRHRPVAPPLREGEGCIGALMGAG